MVLTFKINKLLALKLEERKSNVYINDLKFTQCKHLKINISKSNYKKYNDINSIDEIIDLDEEAPVVYIPPEVEFWAHCSNLQVWYENDYDTRLMDSKLAFPLLEKLAQEGDKIAKRVFKEEIIKRVLDGYVPTIMYLFEELEYLDNFYKEELWNFYEIITEKQNITEDVLFYVKSFILATLIKEFNDIKAKNLFKTQLKNIIRKGDNEKYLLLDEEYLLLEVLDRDAFWECFNEESEVLKAIENELKGYNFKLVNQKIDFNLGHLLFKFEKNHVTSIGITSITWKGETDISIKTLPTALANLKKLKELYLIGLNLQEIPKFIINLNNLEILDLSYNKIIEIPEWIGRMPKLKILHIEENKITSISEFAKKKRLKIII